MSLGGTADARALAAEEVAMVVALKAAVEAKAGGALAAFEPVKVRTQSVAGTNYFVKVSVGDGKFVHVRIHKPLSGDAEVAAVQTGKAEADALDYFEA